MTRKRRSATGLNQLDLFSTPKPALGPASFAGVDQWVSAAVAEVLKEDLRSRYEIAGALSSLIGDDSVSKTMLDAYASEARDTHNISFGRALALIAATQNRTFIEAAVNRLGGSILWGEEINAARLGHLRAQRAAIDAEIKAAERAAKPIVRGGRHA
jgi:hypothetical protein